MTSPYRQLPRHHWSLEWLHGGFQAAIDALQERIGYTFVNRDILIQALTSPGFANLFLPDKCTSNKALEWEGDRIVTEHVGAWVSRLPVLRPHASGYLVSFLKSNLYFSRRALELELDTCVRITSNNLRAQRAETQIRMTANAFEALIAAVERDAGPKACKAFVHRFVLPDDELMQSIAMLAPSDIESLHEGFGRIVKGRAELWAVRDHGKSEIHVFLDGCRLAHRKEARHITDVAREVIFAALKANPWLFWGCENAMSLYLPCASKSAFGTPIPSQNLYRSGRTEIPPAWLMKKNYQHSLVSMIQGVALKLPEPRARFHEEDAWPACDLPERLAVSTADRGPYIDKLRIRLAPASLEVRIQTERKSVTSRYAFYVDREYRSTLEAKNLNDAANQFLRMMDGKYE